RLTSQNDDNLIIYDTADQPLWPGGIAGINSPPSSGAAPLQPELTAAINNSCAAHELKAGSCSASNCTSGQSSGRSRASGFFSSWGCMVVLQQLGSQWVMRDRQLSATVSGQ